MKTLPNVHVSIVNWVKSSNPELLPAKRKLWFKVQPTAEQKNQWKREGKRAHKEYSLNQREVGHINSGLSDKTDVTGAIRLPCNLDPQRVFQGVTPGHEGFVLSLAEGNTMVRAEPRAAEVLFPYLIGREIVSGNGAPRRCIIDFQERNLLEARTYSLPFARVTEKVLPTVQKKAEEEEVGEEGRKQHLERWWQHWRRRADMKAAIANLGGRYITSSRTQRWPFVFCFVAKTVLPGDKMQIFAFDDDYSFGILQAAPHIVWYEAKAARLKNEEDYNYSTESVFDTFPWPQNPTQKALSNVAKAGREVRKVRETVLPKIVGGLRAVYRTLELPGANPLKDAHTALDAAVLDAYGFSTRRDLLSQLLGLNEEVYRKILRGEAVTAPGLPASARNPAGFVTSDYVSHAG